MVSQRQLDGNWGSCGLRKVLAVEHEQRKNVPGAQRSTERHKVSTTSNGISPHCIRFYVLHFNKWHPPTPRS